MNKPIDSQIGFLPTAFSFSSSSADLQAVARACRREYCYLVAVTTGVTSLMNAVPLWFSMIFTAGVAMKVSMHA
jgi:hypothetical protein